MDEVFNELAHNHPHHSNRETNMNNYDNKFKNFKNILDKKHAFDTIVVNQIIRGFFRILDNELLKIFFLFFLYY